MGCPAIALCSRCAVCESACGELLCVAGELLCVAGELLCVAGELLCVAGELCVRVHADKKKEVQVEGYK